MDGPLILCSCFVWEGCLRVGLRFGIGICFGVELCFGFERILLYWKLCRKLPSGIYMNFSLFQIPDKSISSRFATLLLRKFPYTEKLLVWIPKNAILSIYTSIFLVEIPKAEKFVE